MSSYDSFLNRLVDFLVDCPDVRKALIELINARAEAERELAAWRKRRK